MYCHMTEVIEGTGPGVKQRQHGVQRFESFRVEFEGLRPPPVDTSCLGQVVEAYQGVDEAVQHKQTWAGGVFFEPRIFVRVERLNTAFCHGLLVDLKENRFQLQQG